MKKYLSLFSLIILIIFISGCSKDESDPVINTQPQSLTIKGIKGKIYNWTLGSSKLIQFSSFGSSSVDQTGQFEINNLAVPYGDQLKNILNYYSGFTQQPILSDQSVNYYVVSSLRVAEASDPTKRIGYVQKCASTNTSYVVGEYFTWYLYLDKPLTIDGISAYTYTYGTLKINFKEVYNKVTFEQGWNKFVNKIYAVDATTNTITLEIVREEPNEGIWNYFTASSANKPFFPNHHSDQL